MRRMRMRHSLFSLVCQNNLKELKFPKKNDILKKNTEVVVLPRADYVMHEKDHLLVVGLTKDIDRLLASIK